MKNYGKDGFDFMKISVPKLDPFVMIGIIISTINVSLSYSQFLYFPIFHGALYRLSILVFIFSILRKKYSLKALLAFVAIGLIALYSSIKSQNSGFLLTVITCFAIYKEDIKDVLKTIFIIELLFFATHTFLALLALLFFGTPLNMQISGVTRYNFGMAHPNEFALYYFQLVLLWVALYYPSKNHKHRYIILIAIVSLAVYKLTVSRTMLITTAILCLLLLITHYNTKTKWLNIAAKYIFPTTAVCMIVFYVLFSLMLLSNNTGGFIAELDDALSSRIKLAAYGYSHYGLTLFGQDLSQYTFSWDETWGMTRYYTDGIYPYFAFNIGLIWIAIISVLFYKLAGKKDRITNILIIIWTLYGLSETHVINGYICFPIFLVTQIKRQSLYSTLIDKQKLIRE